MAKRSTKVRLTLTVRTKYWEDERVLSSEQIAKLTGVSTQTAYRWCNHPDKIPPGMIELMQIKVFGLIPDPEFDGWKVSEGSIWSPTAKYKGLRSSEIDMMYFTHASVRTLTRALESEREKAQRMAKLADQYRRQVPGMIWAANDDED